MRSKCTKVLCASLAALVLSAVGASAAFATEALEWYSSATAPAAEWQQGGSRPTEAVATKSSGKIVLADVKAKAKVECTGTGEGSVGPGGVGKETSLTLSGCVAPAKAQNETGEEVTNECTKLDSAKIINLPWHTELDMAGYMYDAMTSEGEEGAGFKIECTHIIKVTDTCKAAQPFKVGMSNVTGGVEATFNGEWVFNCNLGGLDGGKIEGTQLIEATKGGKLETNFVGGSYSRLTSAIPVKAVGKLEIEDHGSKLKLAAECEFALKGTVGPGSEGTFTSVTGSGCQAPAKMRNAKEEEVANECGTLEGEGLEAVDLPWSTELERLGGSSFDGVTKGTGGTPEWRFTCKSGSKEIVDECGFNVKASTANILGENVIAAFDEPFHGGYTTVDCSYGGDYGMWTGELKFTPESGAIVTET